MNELLLVLDFGGQYKELIARVVRELGVYSEIRPGNISAAEVARLAPVGIILTGGPASVYAPSAPAYDADIFHLGVPVLGICYGMQLLCHALGGEVAPGDQGEYGRVMVTADASSTLFNNTQKSFAALMSHRDAVSLLPTGFVATASTDACIAACEHAEKRLFGVQFHPESQHTDGGRSILENFVFGVCGAAGDYTLDDYIDTQVESIRRTVGKEKVLLALSGGVDSSVCAVLLSKAIPGQLTCIFIDHGFMRLHEGDQIERVFSRRKLRFIRVDAQDRFLDKIKDVPDAEQKRKLIGKEFIRVFEEEAEKLGNVPFLAQGTIYADIVESGGMYGATIKSHHNVGGLPEDHAFTKVIEPLAGLFKDQVRALGKKLGLPASLVGRQPFPGPGLAVRVMGEVTKEKLDMLRLADHIVCAEIEKSRKRPQQYFAVLTDAHAVGVKGDERTYDPVIAVRAVDTKDFMTCEYTPLSHQVLKRISARITSEVKGASRVVYDITSKPPATVEWE
ncbi:glutamine-hydrolyzing GMP synthase [Christensenellaceae bacterium OttesenSCG-928-L17]|nr:glutamine-hydrolyzing GMP synthase [Christensenellaceae bacterium OttesenSCG-928-L17]